MDKPAIKKFAVWARKKLIADTKYRAGLVGVTETAVAEPLPQSNETVQFFDVGLPQPYRIEGEAVTQRQRFVAELNKETAKQGSYTAAYQTVVDKVAYTWFNRLIAVRYMEVNDLLPSRTRVLSSADGRAEPQIVTSPFDAVLDYSSAEQQQIVTLKNDNKLDEVFRLLFLKQCAALGDCLPRLFEQVDDYMPLLLALSFTDKDGVVCHLVNDIPESDWQDAVQIVGWLYQYYNTEPKEQVFANLKKNIKISAENIPAATQLFTPDWIVRYMVENSLGRLWSEGHPDFDKSDWKYYLDEAPQEPQVAQQLAELRKGYAALTPEDIKCIDPCMGSGHILAYLFDVLMQIYRSAGYTDRDAAASIVEHNLYGLDIDDRAAQMAYFVVMMKGCHYDSRFLRRHLKPHVYAIQESGKLSQTAFGYCGPEEPTARTLWDTFRNAKEYGSILQPKVTLEELDKLEARLQEADRMAGYGSLGVQGLTYQLLDVMYPLIDQARMLVQKYDVVVTNPPYMGASNMNNSLNNFIKENYFYYKSDFFAAFIVRCTEMAKPRGRLSFLTPYVWMFILSYEKLRKRLLTENTIESLIQFEYSAFEEAVVPICTFSICNEYRKNYISDFIRLTEYKGGMEVQRLKTIEAAQNHNCGYYYETKLDIFLTLPSYPLAYWQGNGFIEAFNRLPTLSAVVDVKKGMTTADNNTFLRFWWEVMLQQTNKNSNSNAVWFKTHKGGEFRKWYGNSENVVNWENDGAKLKAFSGAVIRNEDYYLKECVSWNDISSAKAAFRYVPYGSISNASGPSFYGSKENLLYLIGLCNSKVCEEFLTVLCPTIHFEVGQMAKLPTKIAPEKIEIVDRNTDKAISLSRLDWDSFETSWDFKRHPLV